MIVTKKDYVEFHGKWQKSKYNKGFCPKEFKLSGVKKLIVFFASPTCEWYHNLSTILSDLGINALDFSFSMDIKMVLIICGKQYALSKYCCPFCPGCTPWLGSFQSVTVGSLWSNYTGFVSSGSDIKHASKYGNVINAPLITGPEDKLILDIVNFPELHVLTGVVGKLVKEFERKVFVTAEDGKNFMDCWMVQPSVNVSHTVYHGSAKFKGNMERKHCHSLTKW